MAKILNCLLDEPDLVVGNFFHKLHIERGARLLYKIVKVTKKAVYAEHYIEYWDDKTKILKHCDKPKRFNKIDIIDNFAYELVEGKELKEVKSFR